MKALKTVMISGVRGGLIVVFVSVEEIVKKRLLRAGANVVHRLVPTN